MHESETGWMRTGLGGEGVGIAQCNDLRCCSFLPVLVPFLAGWPLSGNPPLPVWFRAIEKAVTGGNYTTLVHAHQPSDK